MIPTDLLNLSRLRLPTETSVQPVAASQAVSDILAELIPGQRIIAEIQAQLPNGAYRALVSQREITLALPFSAKAGDSLELQVVDNDGKLALAVLARPSGETGDSEATATSLSRTGQLISDLLAGTPRDAKDTAPPLRASTPISSEAPTDPKALAPLLEKAITSSGLFYESHQAQWFEGKFSQAALLNEPQGKLSPSFPSPLPNFPQPNSPLSPPPLPSSLPSIPISENGRSEIARTNSLAITPEQLQSTNKTDIAAHVTTGNTASQVSTPIAAEALPLVRQQLESLATNVYTWHGQIWPGQDMRWELVEENAHRQQPGNEEQLTSVWKTRLSLTLPNLGVVDARLGLQDNHLSLHLAADEDQTRERLRTTARQLFGRIEAAGMDMTSFAVAKHEPREE